MAIEFPLQTKFVTTTDLVSAEVTGEQVMLNLATGIYYGLNQEGAITWTLIQEGKTVAAMQQAIMAEFDVTPEQCLQDLQELLNHLYTNKLIEVHDESAAALAPTE